MKHSLLEKEKIRKQIYLYLKKGYPREKILSILNLNKDMYYVIKMSDEDRIKRLEYQRKAREKSKIQPYFYLKQNIKQFQKKSKITDNFSLQDVLNKFGPSPKCALSGEEIDYNNTKTYNLDHIIPFSRGGTGNLDNLQLVTPRINLMKSNLSNEEFINLCKKIVENTKIT